MKQKIITVISGLIAVTSIANAESYLEIKKIEIKEGNTVASFERGYSNNGTSNTPMMTFDMTFIGVLNATQTVAKAAMITDPGISVFAKGTSKVDGQTAVLAARRYEAFVKGGVAGYFVELAKQQLDMGIKW